MQSEKIIKLSDCAPFASGASRLCFVHPQDSEKCVKVFRQGFDGESRLRRKSPLTKIFRSAADYDHSLCELQECNYLAQLGDERVWRHIPRHFGMIETDLGLGSVTQLLRNPDGAIASNLIVRMQSGFDESCRIAISELLDFLADYPLVWRDSDASNVVAVKGDVTAMKPTDGGEGLNLYIVDGIGLGARGIPFLNNWRLYRGFSGRNNAAKFRRQIEMRERENQR